MATAKKPTINVITDEAVDPNCVMIPLGCEISGVDHNPVVGQELSTFTVTVQQVYRQRTSYQVKGSKRVTLTFLVQTPGKTPNHCRDVIVTKLCSAFGVAPPAGLSGLHDIEVTNGPPAKGSPQAQKQSGGFRVDENGNIVPM